MNTQLAIHPNEGTPLTPTGTGPKDVGGEPAFEFDIRKIWSSIYRNRYLVGSVIALALIAGVLLTILSPRVYRATSTVQIEQQTSRILSAEEGEPAMSSAEVDRFLQTQVDILRSHAIAERVAESLNLFRDDTFLIKMGEKVELAPAGRRSADLARREQVIGLLMNNMTVALPRTSRIVSISFSSRDPELAQQVANNYARSYIVANLQRRFDASSYSRSFLERQLALAKQRLEASERAAITYAQSAQLLDTSGGVSPATGGGETSGIRSLTTSDLVQLNTALVTARADRVAAEQRWQQALRTPLLSLPEVQTNSSIQQLSQQRAAAQAAYEQDLQRRKPEFPAMKQAAAQIAALDAQILQIAGRVRDGIRNQYEVAQKLEQSLQANVGQLKGATFSEQVRSVQYNILKRESDTNRTMYDGLLQRYKEVSAQAGITTNNITQLDMAERPNIPISPRPLMNMAIALLLGLGVAVLAVFIKDRFDDAIRSPDDVAAKLGVPFLNSIPMLPRDVTPREALDDVRSAFSEAYFALRASLRLSSSAGLPRSILFTSSRESEGKSTTAVATARAFAQIGMRVLLMDGDLRRPSLHRVLAGHMDRGLSTVLARQDKLEAVVQGTEFENLSFVSMGPMPPNPTELLSGTTLGEVIGTAVDQYDIVLIDGPPVLGLADSILYATAVEGTIYVVEAGRANQGQTKAALRRLHASGARIIGAVLTKFNPRHAGYGHEYSYYYSYGSPTEKTSPALES